MCIHPRTGQNICPRRATTNARIYMTAYSPSPSPRPHSAVSFAPPRAQIMPSELPTPTSSPNRIHKVHTGQSSVVTRQAQSLSKSSDHHTNLQVPRSCHSRSVSSSSQMLLARAHALLGCHCHSRREEAQQRKAKSPIMTVSMSPVSCRAR